MWEKEKEQKGGTKGIVSTFYDLCVLVIAVLVALGRCKECWERCC
jgi:hypothetical protein